MNPSTERRIHSAFLLTLLWKASTGLLQCVGGFSLLFIKPETLHRFAFFAVRPELREDPQDKIAQLLTELVTRISFSTERFIAVYLIAHGLINIILSAALFKRKMWAYPLAIVFYSYMAFYQLYRFSHTHAVLLPLLSLIDVFVILLAVHSYREQRRS